MFTIVELINCNLCCNLSSNNYDYYDGEHFVTNCTIMDASVKDFKTFILIGIVHNMYAWWISQFII